MGNCAYIESGRCSNQLETKKQEIQCVLQFQQFIDDEFPQESSRKIVNNFKTQKTRNYFIKITDDQLQLQSILVEKNNLICRSADSPRSPIQSKSNIHVRVNKHRGAKILDIEQLKRLFLLSQFNPRSILKTNKKQSISHSPIRVNSLNFRQKRHKKKKVRFQSSDDKAKKYSPK